MCLKFGREHNLSEDEQGELLHLLREVAFAGSETQYRQSLDYLLASSVYKGHPRVQRYLKTKWLGCTTVSYAFTCAQLYRDVYIHPCTFRSEVFIYL